MTRLGRVIHGTFRGNGIRGVTAIEERGWSACADHDGAVGVDAGREAMIPRKFSTLVVVMTQLGRVDNAGQLELNFLRGT